MGMRRAMADGITNNPFEDLFSQDEVSLHPLKTVFGTQVDFRRIKEKRYLLKKTYQIISNPDRLLDSNSVHWRVNALRFLEHKLRTKFVNTRDLKRKIMDFLSDYEVRRIPVNVRIRKARKKKRWRQKDLANCLGYKCHVPISYFEKGLRYPPAKVFRWLKEVEM